MFASADWGCRQSSTVLREETMAALQVFGRTPDGEDVNRVEIAAGKLRAGLISWGASIQDLRLDGHGAPLVLGFETLEHYFSHGSHVGATPGRFANRIKHGRFSLDGEDFQVDRNQNGQHMLHGGSKGFSKRNWRLLQSGEDFATFSLLSADGDMGFPGNLIAQCTYRINAPGTLSIELTATTDRPTLCNMTNHAYFNLDDGGAGNILGHQMVIPAAAYLPNDDDAVPTGVVQPVDGTSFDFRKARTVGESGDQTPYDNNFCLSSEQGALRQAAWAKGARSGIEMETWTTEPGIQFYMGHKMKSEMPAGLDGIQYGPSSGFCLEPQVWPDAPNRAYFPQAVLRPGETYRHVIEYRFR